MNSTFTWLFFLFFFILFSPAHAQVFWQEDFAGGAIPAGWLNEDASGNNVRWEACPGPADCELQNLPPLFPVLNHFNSRTAANGFAFVNSDAAGELAGQGHLSRLRSTTVDCSAYGQVFIQFQTAIATATKASAGNAILRVRAGGEEEVFTLFPTLEQDGQQQAAPVQNLSGGKPYFVTLDISSPAAGAGDVTLEWEWCGNFEFAWIIDDILLSSTHPARPENAVWFEPFSGGPGEWESNALLNPGFNWQWRPGGDVSQAFSLRRLGRDGFIHSETGNDGAMTFNGDFYNTNGEAPPIGFIPEYFICELISPEIDLSAVDEPLALQFSQLAWLGNLAPGAPPNEAGTSFITSFSYSTDGGESWSFPIDANPYQPPATSSNFVSIPPASNSPYFVLPDVQGSSRFKLKFTWAGDFYFWALDDIALVVRPEQDMRANRNFFSLPPNAITPACQARDVRLLADVVNNGRNTARDVRLEAYVHESETGRLIYADTLFFGDVPPDSLVENVFFERPLQAELLSETGEYAGTYTVQHSSEDGRPQDDSLRWSFVVSDSVFAKEQGHTRDIAPAENLDYSYGNCFFIVDGEGLFARSASFAVANANQLGGQNEDVSIFLHEWQGDLNEDGDANPEEYTALAFGTYEFDGDEGLELIHVPLFSADSEDIPLRDSTYYLLVVSYETNFGPPCFVLANDTIDYQATNFVTDSLGRPEYASVLDVGNTGTYSTVGFGFDVVPVVRLHIGPSGVCSPVSTVTAFEKTPFSLAPNPANDWLRVILHPENRHSELQFQLIDMSGSIVLTKKIGLATHNELNLNVRHLPSGLYQARLRSADRPLASTAVVIQR